MNTTQVNLTSGTTLLKFSHQSSVPVQILINKCVAIFGCVLYREMCSFSSKCMKTFLTLGLCLDPLGAASLQRTVRSPEPMSCHPVIFRTTMQMQRLLWRFLQRYPPISSLSLKLRCGCLQLLRSLYFVATKSHCLRVLGDCHMLRRVTDECITRCGANNLPFPRS